jgi:hypothetical protein
MQRVEAVVRMSPPQTRYVRAGRGAPVLLLFDEGAVAAVASQLQETLVFGVPPSAPRPERRW